MVTTLPPEIAGARYPATMDVGGRVTEAVPGVTTTGIGIASDGGMSPDGRMTTDGGVAPNNGIAMDGGMSPDNGITMDGGMAPDADVNRYPTKVSDVCS